MSATLNQLAIALGKDVESTKSVLIEVAQNQENYEFAREVQTWKASTELPDWVIEFADQQGLDISRKRRSKGMGGELANTPEIIQGFVSLLPQTMAKHLAISQQNLNVKAKRSGLTQGAIDALTERQAYMQGYQATANLLNKGVGSAFDKAHVAQSAKMQELFGEGCNLSRALDEFILELSVTNTEDISDIAALENQLNELLGKQ